MDSFTACTIAWWFFAGYATWLHWYTTTKETLAAKGPFTRWDHVRTAVIIIVLWPMYLSVFVLVFVREMASKNRWM